MAINKNHEFEDLDGVKCAVVEKNASKERVTFLKELLEHNKFTVIVVPSPPPKPAATPKPVPIEASASVVAPPPSTGSPGLIADPAAPPAPETFTVGVTNVAFNPTNAIFGRLLRTKDGRIVTLAYWEQKENVSDDSVPYFE